MDIKKIYYSIITFVPCLALFTPPVIFGILSSVCFILLVLNVNLFKKIIKYNYNYLIFLFGIFSLIITLINQNYSGLPISIGLNMIILYFMYIRYIMNEKIFNIMYLIIGIGSLYSHFYARFNIEDNITNSIINFLRNSFHLNFNLFNNDIQKSSFFLNRNYFGYISALIILLSAFVVLKEFKNLEKTKQAFCKIIFSLVIIFFNMSSLIMTESRGAYIALVVGLGILIITMFNSTILISIPITGIILLNFDKIIVLLPRFETILSSSQSRLNLWHKGLCYINKNPWFGNGFYTLLSKEEVPHSHNIFIEALVCFGIIGVLLITIFVMLTLWDKAKRWVENQNDYFPLIISVIMATTFHGFNDMILLNPATILLFVILYSFSEIDNYTK